jgi:nucleotide-binding universal stress UspA family protein
MPQKILAPLDGSRLAESILPYIVAYTRVNGTEVTFVRVIESDPTAPDQNDPVDWHLRKVEARAYLDRLADELRPFGLSIQTEVLEGPIADRLIEFAQRQEYDLIALSSHGQSGLSGWTLGSVAQKVILRSRKSILLVPAYADGATTELNAELGALTFQRILVPLDGSQRAESVLAKASALARHHGAELLLIHVVTPPHLLQRMPLSEEDLALSDRIVERNQYEAERYFEQLSMRLEPTPQTRVLRGEHVPTELQRLIQQEAIDLVILTAHGHVHDDRRPYGNLATSLLTYGSAPLVVFQDLAPQEIEPTAAERAINALDFTSPQRLNPPQMVPA